MDIEQVAKRIAERLVDQSYVPSVYQDNAAEFIAAELRAEMESQPTLTIEQVVEVLNRVKYRGQDNWQAGGTHFRAGLHAEGGVIATCDALIIAAWYQQQSQPRPPELPGWQPIQTVPKDLTLVLTYMSDGTMAVMYGKVEDYHGSTPTHWMPLPSGPLSSKEQISEH